MRVQDKTVWPSPSALVPSPMIPNLQGSIVWVQFERWQPYEEAMVLSVFCDVGFPPSRHAGSTD
jgi:hypothetical protein